MYMYIYNTIFNYSELRCNPPLFTDPYMIYQCPEGFTYGSKCNLRCMGKFPLVGNHSIVCEKNSTNDPPSTYWNKGISDPYCKSENTILTINYQYD